MMIKLLLLLSTWMISFVKSYDIFNPNNILGWKDGPFNQWSDVPLSMIPLDQYPSCDDAVDCIGNIDLSETIHNPNCKSVSDGNVFVSNVILSPPLCLETIVNGSLIIEYNDNVTALTGFGRLREITLGNIIIRNNKYLVSLRGLDALEYVEGDIIVEGNGQSITLSALDTLVVLERWAQQNNKSEIPDSNLHFPRRNQLLYLLEDRGNFDPHSTTCFSEDTLVGLTGLYGLGNLTSIGGSFIVVGNPEMLDFGDVRNLKTIGGNFVVERNHKMQNLNGLDALQQIDGNFSLFYNTQMQTAQGMPVLSTIGGSWRVANNEKLVEIGNWGNYINVGGDMIVFQNNEMLNIALAGPLVMQYIGGSLVIEDNQRLQSLQGLQELVTINVNLEVLRNPQLTTLQGGLTALTTVGGDMYVQGEFPTYDGLTSLSSVGGSLWIHSLPNLESVQGMETLGSIGEHLYVVLNPALVSLSEFTLFNVGGRVVIYANPYLASVNGLLESLVNVGESLHIQYLNGTIECPQGTGVADGELPMIYDPNDPDMSTSKNWCTLNCAYPRETITPSGYRMWQCQSYHMWDPSWGPYCSE